MDKVKVRCVGRKVLKCECVTFGDILFKSIPGHLFSVFFLTYFLDYLRQRMLRIHEVRKSGRIFRRSLKYLEQHAKEDI